MGTADEYARRREQFLERMGPGVALLPAAPVAIRNNDVEHEYRQDSDFYYLTGFDEPESVLLLTNQHESERCVLFVRPRNPERETWDGPRAGVEGACQRFGADAAHPIAELEQRLPDYLKDVKRVHYPIGRDRSFDDVVFRVLGQLRALARRGVTPPHEFVDLAPDLHAMRLHKSAGELDQMRRAADVTREAHARAMDVARPGAFEYEVEAELLRVFRARGAERPAYGSIVGSGINATVLHYRRNDRRMQDGDLLLIDAGCELGYYASDVTRTFPVGGRFTEPQRALYDLVLEAQEAAIEAVQAGVSWKAPHERAVAVLAEGMVRLGLIDGPVDEAIEKERYKPYYMHNTSHWLGMDVHDVGDYFADGEPLRLDEGMVLTIEPGIYITEDAEVDPRYRGIGIRIEDDVAVTAEGPSILTADIPKAADELERILQAR